VFETGQFQVGWGEWQRHGQVEIVPGSGVAKVTLSDNLIRGIAIDDSVTYRYSMEVRSTIPGALMRLQINWHDGAGAFLTTTIVQRRCSAHWSVYAADMTPPPGAKTGIVIVGAHTAMPVLVRSVSLRYPVRAGRPAVFDTCPQGRYHEPSGQHR
jgi:hypothetical protein